ncbi:Ypt/Rab-GAP domain of gyp1p superfamily protein [Prunus dulcis]|uniref:Ypt/Rab-GAP domain of gyp1p superfamily protein n=1 Tax=Prunus dulcis TaxID=3755 RepID=A0A4Y1RXA3_PRUDU|nr:Ypt/Rab-GAP domain of gyp1p superfamily protein [Prunus dulcis]
MLKGKLKLPDKAKRAFPDRLGSLVAGFEDKEEENRGSDLVFESGEELETIQPNGYGSGGECENDEDDEDYDEKVDRESDLRVRPKPEREGSGSVSVLAAIAADDKRSDLEYELSQPEINLEKLQRIASSGLPDGGRLRATAWKLLLGYLPPSRDLWEKELIENRLKYAKLKEELLVSPSQLTRKKVGALSYCDHPADGVVAGPLKRHEISEEDHPLSLGKASVWHQYFQHTEIAEQIDRDLQRTHPDLKFFSGDSSFSRKHRESMRSILLLFAKLNPVIRYVQGMNEVLAPIYYVFSTDTNEQNAANAEADSFSCFVRLLSDSVDHFCEQLDNSAVGILSTLSRLSELLKANDEELWRHLEFTTKVKPQYYAFRWITLLLTQEFNFQCIMRIWDSLLSSPYGVQNYPDINIEHLLQVARDLSSDPSTYRLSLTL